MLLNSSTVGFRQSPELGGREQQRLSWGRRPASPPAAHPRSCGAVSPPRPVSLRRFQSRTSLLEGEVGGERLEVALKIPDSSAGAEVPAEAAFGRRAGTARRVRNRLTEARCVPFMVSFSFIFDPGFSARGGGGRPHVRRVCVRGRVSPAPPRVGGGSRVGRGVQPTLRLISPHAESEMQRRQ